MFIVKRSRHNPILTPEDGKNFEGTAVFNPSPVKRGMLTYMLYRAISVTDPISEPHQRSVVGVAQSVDGKHFIKRMPFITPSESFDTYGCEDPRVTFFEKKYYTFYTGLSKYPFVPDGIKVAVAVSSDLQKVKQKHLVTPFNAKAMALFPERINGKVTVIFSAHTDLPPTKIAIMQTKNVEDLWNPKTWNSFETNIDSFTIDDPRRNSFDHIEVGAPPIKTKYGWLLIYSYIQNYFGAPNGGDRVFGIEAMLLDLKDPRKIIGKTKGPLLTPEEGYEKNGIVSNIVFPTGAFVHGDTLHIFYGGADTTCCRAQVNVTDLLSTMMAKTSEEWKFKRYSGNPTLSPEPKHVWEAQAVFNPGAILLDGKVHIIYRALSPDNTSTIGYAMSKDGLKIDKRLAQPIYTPRADFESKKIPNGNSGCEDARIMKIDNRLYICYTAFDGIGPPRVAVSSIAEKDFLKGVFNWSAPQLITPPGVDDKDACILPEKVAKKYLFIHRIGTDICADYLPSLDFSKAKVNKCIRIIGPRYGFWDSAKVGLSAPPIKTKKGWLMLYHGISKTHHTYRVGAVLLDKKDPTVVLARSADAIFEPEEQYEKVGVVNNVVFPCGVIEKKGILYIYYGGADRVCGVATIKLSVVLNALTRKIDF